MKLFDNLIREDDSFASNSEPIFDFINRSARIEADRIRKELEDWFSRYPKKDQKDLRGQFRSNKNSQHQAAFFELFLHELLRRMGCQIEIHPKLEDIGTSPDFFVTHPDGSPFYLEVTITSFDSKQDEATKARINQVYDVINRRLDSPDYYIWVQNVEGAPKKSPSAKKIVSFLTEKLRELNWEEISDLYKNSNRDSYPRWRYQEDDWILEFRPIPKGKEYRGSPNVRPIGMMGEEIKMVDHRTPLRNAINAKASKYGNLDHPYIIAVNALEMIDEIDIMEALFGKEQFTYNFSIDGKKALMEPRFSRVPDGVWIGPNGPQNTRVSGVLLAVNLSSYNFPRKDLELLHNPWAQNKYESILTELNQAVPGDNKLVKVEGKTTNSYFDLPDKWPEDSTY